MAILGAQLVFSLVVFSFLQKLAKFYSVGRWMLKGKLHRYLHPTDEQLRTAAGISSSTSGAPHGKARQRKVDKSDNKNISDGFSVPRNTAIELETARVEVLDLVQLHYYEDFQWLIDFSVSALVVYILTEIYYATGYRIEVNISILWCLLSIGFALRILLIQTKNYFATEDGGERILCICFAFFFLVMSMGILVMDESKLEFGLEEGYRNFSENALNFMKQQGIESDGPVSFLTFKIILVLICTISGALLTFPGLRYAKLHLDTLKYSRGRRVRQLLLHLNFILPLIIVALWFRPLGRDVICAKNWNVTYKLMDERLFDHWRVFLAIIFVALRFSLLIPHLQTYLNMAHERVEQLKKESGRINSVELQRMVARVFYYMVAVALQYVAPLVILLFLVLMQKTLGDYAWSGLFGESVELQVSQYSMKPPAPSASSFNTNTTTSSGDGEDDMAKTAAKLSLALMNLRGIFSILWYRGIFAFLTWWLCASWFTCTAFGMFYYTSLSSV